MVDLTELYLIQTRFRVKEDPLKLDMSGYGIAIPSIAAYERSKGIITKIYDPNLTMDTYQDILDNIINVNPLVLGISRITSSFIEDVYELVSDIRNKGYNGFIFLGGHAPSLEYKKILQNCKDLDCVVIGEGEKTIYELVTAIREGKEWKSIDGLAFLENQNIITNKMRPLIKNLDELPFMATDFLEELQLKHGKNVTAYMISSRGCYKNCSFCSIAAYFDMFEGCRMRYRSIKNVFEEMKYLYYNYNIRKFCFWDDNFIMPGKKGIERCRELVDLIKTLPEKIDLELETRVDTISYEVISLLKEGGLKYIHIGIESIIERDLILYNKGVTVKQNLNALEILKKLGFSTRVGSKYRIATYLICFNPYTTLEDVKLMSNFFNLYNISPKKQISALRVTDNTHIKEVLKKDGIYLSKNNEWAFLDNRVEDVFLKYCSFVRITMKERDKLRTIEKMRIYNEKDETLKKICSLRENIDLQCNHCLEKLVKLYLDCKEKDFIELEYQKCIQEFNFFINEMKNTELWKCVSNYEGIFIQENL